MIQFLFRKLPDRLLTTEKKAKKKGGMLRKEKQQLKTYKKARKIVHKTCLHCEYMEAVFELFFIDRCVCAVSCMRCIS